MAAKLRTLLAIDDEVPITETLRYVLEYKGMQVETASGGILGLKLAKTVKPDLILLDWMMPGMDGLEMLKVLRQDPMTKDTPVFMLTARGSLGDIDRAFEAGVDDYIIKPFDPARISDQIKEKWERYQADLAKQNS